MTSLKKDEVWYILVDTDSLHKWPMMLCLYDTRCIRIFFSSSKKYISLLFHFKAFFKIMSQLNTLKVTKYAEKTSVFKGKGVHDSGQLGLSFGICVYL